MDKGVVRIENTKYLCKFKTITNEIIEVDLVWHNGKWCYPNTLEESTPYGKVIEVIRYID